MKYNIAKLKINLKSMLTIVLIIILNWYILKYNLKALFRKIWSLIYIRILLIKLKRLKNYWNIYKINTIILIRLKRFSRNLLTLL